MSRAPQQAPFEDVGSARTTTSAGSSPVGETSRPGGLRVLHGLDESRWSAFVRDHPDASIFHTPEMHRVFELTKGHRPSVWAVVDGSDSVRALLTSVSIATVGAPFRALTARNVSFAGPLVDGDPGALPTLLGAYRRGVPSALFSEIRNVVDPRPSLDDLAACGFRHEPHLNFLIDLTVPERELWRGVASSAQRNIRKARRLGVTVEAVDDGVDEAYPVLRSVYRRIQVPLPDRSLFDAATRILGPLGRFTILLARHEGRTIGALTLLRHEGVATYWYTGALDEFRSHRPGDLLVAAALETARAAGCRVFDFGGAGRPDEPYGVRDFKAKYGGRLVDWGRDVWVPSPIKLRAATSVYGLLRRFL